MNLRWRKHYQKLQAAARLMNRPVCRVKLGTPENICDCAPCDRKRRILRNWRAKRAGRPIEPALNLPSSQGCPCAACIRRRAERKRLHARRRDANQV